MTPFAPWAPDVADLNAAVARDIKNVLPGNNCYVPAQALAEFSVAVAAEIRGGCMVRDTSGALVIFVGTATKLYKYVAGAWVDVSRLVGGAYAVPASDFWEFVQFGDTLIATNIANVMQSIAITAGSNFAALAGSPPQARHIVNIGGYVVASGLAGALNRVHWSGTEDATSWTPGTGNSDIQDMPDGGDCGRISGRETGLLLQRDGVRQMVYQPSSPLIFTFTRVENARGSFPPYSTINVSAVTFYYGLDGFYAYANGQSDPIGSGYVNDWFAANYDPNSLYSMIGVADPRATRVLWAFKSNSGGTARFDTIIGFDFARRRWFYTRQDVEFIMAAATLGYTLEGLDAFGTMDSIIISLDSPSWQGGIPALAGFSTNHKLAFFDGANLEGTVETAETQLNPPGRAIVMQGVPYIDCATVAMSAGVRETFQGTTVYGPEGPLERTGVASLRGGGRYHRFKCRMPAGAPWSKAMGVDVAYVPGGMT